MVAPWHKNIGTMVVHQDFGMISASINDSLNISIPQPHIDASTSCTWHEPGLRPSTPLFNVHATVKVSPVSIKPPFRQFEVSRFGMSGIKF